MLFVPNRGDRHCRDFQYPVEHPVIADSQLPGSEEVLLQPLAAIALDQGLEFQMNLMASRIIRCS